MRENVHVYGKKKKYIYIYIYIYVFMKMFMIEFMVTLCYKDKVKGKSTKVI